MSEKVEVGPAGLGLRSDERRRRALEAGRDANNLACALMGEADKAWTFGHDTISVDIPTLLVLLVLAAERLGDIAIGRR